MPAPNRASTLQHRTANARPKLASNHTGRQHRRQCFAAKDCPHAPHAVTICFHTKYSTEMNSTKTILSVSIVLLLIVVYTQLTLFIIPPIGAVPEGKTLVILRLNKTNFIDSPDGMCDRIQGGVSLMCRAMSAAAVIEKTTILMRLPYSSLLYKISTNGKSYDH